MNIFTRVFGEPVTTIRALELQEELSNGNEPFLVDVRQPKEFRMAHIANAKLIPLGELSRRISEVPRDREVVCICATGHRSVPAVRKLAAEGYTARSLKNGMIAWQMSKLPVKKGL
ncbi:MAG TPA: rhodanese-like domain-containing protein [Anaerolineales bacterium]|nr:rhodanese-like domain-containing protein [Anaerolineales bacterium]